MPIAHLGIVAGEPLGVGEFALGRGKVDDGLAMLREIGRRDRNWIELTLRLPAMLLGADQSVKDRVRKLLD